ncbi:recombinase family protein [Candidatus Pacearchaeota archaeon]|nr:recombinase family protein [Candidatus Pacearchaeota archaeon]
MKKVIIKIAIYLRVSSKDTRQFVENQLLQLREFCKEKNWQIVNIYTDNEKGSKGKRERKNFNQLFKDAQQRKFKLVLIWSLDRFTREGLYKTVNYLQILDSYGISIYSYKDPVINTEDEMMRGMAIAWLSLIANFELQRNSERTMAGLDRALKKADPGKYEKCESCEFIERCQNKEFKYCKKNGKKTGKKSMADLGVDKKIVYLQNASKTDTEIMAELNVSRNTVKKYKVKDEDH